MNECLIYTHPVHPMLLIVFGLLLGLTLGLLLVAGVLSVIGYLDAQQAGKAEQQQKRDQQRQEEEALTRAQTEEVDNAAQDAAIDCSLCWEARHPGRQWPRRWRRKTSLCGTHYNRALVAKVGQTHLSTCSNEHYSTKHPHEYALAG